jgi:hypothetical protein
MRSLTEAKTGLGEEQELDMLRRYEAGESSTHLAKTYGVSAGTVLRIVRRNDGEIRPLSWYGDSIQDAIDSTGLHAAVRNCSFYIFDLANYPAYSKPGIAFDVDMRLRQGQGEYGIEHLCIPYPTRQEAYFLEQAVLEVTIANSQYPPELIDWPGATEVRSMPADDLTQISMKLADEMENLGLWSFACRYVPMTDAQRAVCEQRAR